MTTLRIGEVLVQRGTLTPAQVQAILEQQAQRHRPFGELAENMYGIDPTDIEQAWVEQYARLTRPVDVLRERTDSRAMGIIDRRQAWQFRVLPLRFDGRELVVATTADNLCRALRFVTRCLAVPCYLVLTEAAALGAALERYFPLAGMTAGALGQKHLSASVLLAGD
jgi:hypothetical protein